MVQYQEEKMDELNKLDSYFFSRLFAVSRTAPSPSYFLEMGVLNFEQYIKARRMIYYHNIINRDKHQMIYIFLMTQFLQPSRHDWILQVIQDFKDLEISSDFAFKKLI